MMSLLGVAIIHYNVIYIYNLKDSLYLQKEKTHHGTYSYVVVHENY